MGADQQKRHLTIDMHVHTCASFDCLNEPDAIIARADEIGLDVICITDHNEVSVAQDLAAEWPDRIIVGEEVKTGEGVDVIGLFLHEKIPKGTPAVETCERIREQGGVVYVPHPFAAGKGGGGRILPEIDGHVDAVEAFNARLHDQRLNERAAEWGLERGLPLGAGSDAHTLAELGRARVRVPAFERSRDGLLNALAHGTIDARASSRLVHLASIWARVRKRLP